MEGKYLGIILSIMVIVALTGCGNQDGSGGLAAAAKSGEVYKLKIADISNNPVFRVAKSQGIFIKHHIDAEIVSFATPAEGINSLFIKQAEVGWGADFPVLNAVSKGDYSIIASTGDATDEEAATWKLFVRDVIKDPADFKGKNLSFLRGTFLPYLWDEFLAEQGVSVDEVTFIGQGAMDEAYVALKKGEIDGVWVYGSALDEKFGALDGVYNYSDMSKTSVRLGNGIVVPNELIDQHPDVVTALLQSIEEASQYINGHPDEVAELLYDEVKIPKENTLKDLGNWNWEIGFTNTTYEALGRQKKYMVNSGIIQQDFELDDKLNLDILRDVAAERVTYQP
jgi:ABC-type nitrate/sulfonate/bicarbonate transport system substrate-binding protein